MIHPSYSELIEAINTNNEDDDESMVLNSRYSLILATSKRARQLIGGAKPLADNVKGKKPLSIAIDELYHGKVKILPGKHEEEDFMQRSQDILQRRLLRERRSPGSLGQG